MRNKFRLSVFISIFFLCLFLPRSEAVQEPVAKDVLKELPFANPQTLISMDFQDASLKDILKIFSIQSGLNFIASDVVKDRKFTLYFDGVPIKDAMDKIFKANNLSYELDKESNIFIVNDLGAPETQTITKVFYLKFASVSNSPMQYDKENVDVLSSLGESGGSSSGGSSSSSGGSSSGGGNAIEKASISKIVEKLLSAKGNVVEDYRTNSLIVTDVPSHIVVVEQVIKSLDLPQPQVMLEVEMLDVSKDATEKIGLKFSTPLLTVNTILQGATWGAKWPVGSILGDTSKNFVNGSFKVNSEAAGSTYGAASTYQLVLDFLKTQSSTRYLARPRILTLNNETAEIRIATNESIGVISSITGTTGNLTTTSSAERSETGVLLRVTPQVNMDIGEITMFIVPVVSEATTGSTITIAGAAYTYRDPEVRYTKSMVRIKDGDTVVLGGLLRRNSSDTKTKLPFLGDIPLFGKLFTHDYKDKDRERELLVFITPHIIKETGGVQLAQAKKGVLPEREQNTTSIGSRQAIIDASLKNIEKKKK
ncbi:MAG: hypothetical protein M0R66_06215 [Candidatus Omnitrophica bacterium]|nr:hypothetical protein [Candidatus Omnitrophota bacterium]